MDKDMLIDDLGSGCEVGTPDASIQSMSVLMGYGGQATPACLLGKLQELLERYFHPGHMSSAEKMKLELQRVRDESKISENDCSSARVQGGQRA